MTRTSRYPAPANHPERLALIRRAREAILFNHHTPASDGANAGAPVPVEGWIERSWRRCLAQGQRPQESPLLNVVPPQQLRRLLDANRLLLQAALPVLDKLSRAIAETRSFAILTNADGIVLDARGAIDRSDTRADLITRIGTDLSERAQGTTAVGAVLAEQQAVWLHRGEHFFDAHTDFSCAGAPVFGPNGHCVGILDLTGVQTEERPELRHMVSQFARHIENAMTLGQLSALNAPQRASSLLVRLNWSGCPLGSDADGLVCLDGDGFLLGANQAARQMVPQLNHPGRTVQHSSDVFAMAFDKLFDAARRSTGHPQPMMELPLWSGLRLHAVAQQGGQLQAPVIGIGPAGHSSPPESPRPLKELETALIRQAVVEARGNVVKAARALGVSRATVYRRLGNNGSKHREDPTPPT